MKIHFCEPFCKLSTENDQRELNPASKEMLEGKDEMIIVLTVTVTVRTKINTMSEREEEIIQSSSTSRGQRVRTHSL